MKHVKYPRTKHLPWSLGVTDDDKMHKNTSVFDGHEVVVSIKMDGENTTFYGDGYLHARSLDSRGGVDRDWVKSFATQIAFNLPAGWRVCGENLWARHSIAYENLPSYFMGFSIWDDENRCLSWDETLTYFDLLGITPVKQIYRGIWDEQKIKDLVDVLDLEKDEGYVVRFASAFHYSEFGEKVGKFVRKGHVQTDKHWRHAGIFTVNGLQNAKS